MIDTAFYLVSRDIAIRSGVIQRRYRTKDGRFILDNKDLARVRFTTDEYISGLSGVEKITEARAQQLMAQNSYRMGDIPGYVGRTYTANVQEYEEEEPEEFEEEQEEEPEEEMPEQPAPDEPSVDPDAPDEEPEPAPEEPDVEPTEEDDNE